MLLCCCALTNGYTLAQFSPDGGHPGSTAIHVDSAQWQGWATGASFVEGALDIADPSLGTVGQVSLADVLGPEDGRVVSLGDGGQLTLHFDPPIADGAGPDFAVFENGFPLTDSTGFHELAFVEVSSDGSYFERFACTSLTEGPVMSFGAINPSRVDGFAGKSSSGYGVPFDLADLPPSDSLDLDAVAWVRLIDVIGSPDSAFAKTDSDGAIVYDPYPTPFVTGGFDLDAVGVLHAGIPSSTANPEPVSAELAQRAIVIYRSQVVTCFGESPTALSLNGQSMEGYHVEFAPEGLYWIVTANANAPQLIYLKD